MKTCEKCSREYTHSDRGSKGWCRWCYNKYIYYPRKRLEIIERASKWNKTNQERRRAIQLKSNRKIYKVDMENLLNSATYQGRKWELYVVQRLPDCTDMIIKYGHGSKHDIEWQGLKIDVKSNNNREQSWWSFIKNKGNDADIYYCFGLVDSQIVKVLRVPALIFGKGISVSK